MNYKELLDRYKKGEVTEEERQLIELELEKQEAFDEYILDTFDEEFNIVAELSSNEIHDTETTRLKKSVNNKLRKVILASVSIVMVLLISVFLIISPLIDSLYYNPNEITVGTVDNDISFDIYAISELNMPGLNPSTVSVEKQGFGEYNVMYSYINVFNDESYDVNHKIKRNKITSSHWDYGLKSSMFQSIRNPEFYNINFEDRKKKVLDHIKNLNPISYVSVEILFENDLSMEELYNLELKYPKVEFEWAGIRTNSSTENSNELIGIQLMNSKRGSILKGDDQIKDKYPAFFMIDWLVKPIGWQGVAYSMEAQAYEHHYINILEYVRDREEAIKVLEQRDGKDEFYQSALNFAKENGVKAYGVLAFGESKDLIEIADNKIIKGLNFNQALVSRKNIR